MAKRELKRVTAATRRNYSAFLRGVFKLLEEKPFADITVVEICDASEMTRAAFYGYFSDKEDFYGFVVGELTEGLLSLDGKFNSAKTVKTMAEFVRKNENLAKRLAEGDGTGEVSFQRAVSARLYEIFTERNAEISIPTELFADVVSADACAFVRWLISEGKKHTENGVEAYAKVIFNYSKYLV